MKRNPRLLRITTVPISLKLLLEGQLPFFQSNGFDVMAVSADGPEVDDIKASGIRHQVVGMTRQITPFHDLIALFQLINIIRKFSPDIVHTHTPKAGLLGMIAAFVCRVPSRYHTVAGLPLMESTGMKKILLKLTEKITYACATKIYINSLGLQQYIRRELKSHRPLKVIGRGSSNGINTVFFNRSADLEIKAKAIREQYGIRENHLVFSFVGRIVRDKGIGEIISAFKIIQERTIDHKVFLLLIGPFEQELDPINEHDYQFLHEDAQVILAGFQQDVRPWLMASNVFVFPSYREGFPNVVLQACCLKVPCIVSDINGNNEIIRNGETGIIVPVKKHEALAEAMEMLSNNPALRKQYSEKARQFVVANFDQKYVWGEILKEYRKLLEICSHKHER